MKSSEVPPRLAAIARSYGHRLAELIANYLEQRRATGTAGSPAPLAYLLELGAVLQLTAWEASGFRVNLPADLISAAAARKQLKQRVRGGVSSFEQIESATLFQQVFYCWLENCAWTASDSFDAEFVIADERDTTDQWLDQLARFLWDNRMLLSRLDQDLNAK